MPEILFLAHRIPYPPDRGDRIRSWNVLKHLGRFATVHLATFSDDEADAAHLPALREAMGGALGEALVQPMRRNRFGWATRALVHNEPVVVAAYRNAAVRAFAERLLAERPIESIYAFSVPMALFVPDDLHHRFVMDFVDVDSMKYADYATAGGPLQRLAYRREARKLRALERVTAARATLSLFVTEAETALFRDGTAPPGADVRTLPNGIDLDFYNPQADFEPLSPAPEAPIIVFTGQMNYRPNFEGVAEFARTTLPLIHQARPDVRFAIVGRNPVPAIQVLDGRDGTIVTGRVADVRPWLAAASAVVAPLAIARGVQNKVLEAMAMARPVVASAGAFLGIDATPGRDLIVADSAEEQADAILGLLADPARARAMGEAARRRMEDGYSWEAQLAPLAAMLGVDRARVDA